MKKLILVLSLVLVTTLFLGADVYVKSKKTTEAFEMEGKKVPRSVEVEERWLAENKFALKSAKIHLIGDFEKEMLYFILPHSRCYYQFPTNVDKAKLKELLPPKIYDIIASVKLSVSKVNLNVEKKKIADWDCQGSEFVMRIRVSKLNILPRIKVKMWTTTQLPFDFKRYTNGLNEYFKNLFLGILIVDDHTQKEMEKLGRIDGFEVANEASVMLSGVEIKVKSQCMEVTEKAAPPGTYAVPEGYEKKEISLQRKK
ncbi:MAG: hypothetical protein GY940_21570 [bacterium]|nr:hypothetical protein [bacterium]